LSGVLADCTNKNDVASAMLTGTAQTNGRRMSRLICA
jgi:hypothetical protein